MIHKKHFLYPILLAALWCAAPVAGLHAQDGSNGPRPPHGPPPSPLFDALDTNHDGVIDANEIANASTALKALLKNGATQITREDVRPPHPPRGQGDAARDDAARPDPHFHPDGIRPHGPPDTGDQTANASPTPGVAANDAQASDGGPRFHPDQAEQADRPPHHPHSPPSPLFDALDTNHDGVISAEEMANAAESLKKLERNGANEIKREDLRAVPPPRQNN